MVSDIDHLRVESNTVDCVISNCVINLCEDKEKVYSEIFRVLKSGEEFQFQILFNLMNCHHGSKMNRFFMQLESLAQ